MLPHGKSGACITGSRTVYRTGHRTVFEQLGIRIRSREGWLYPASEQAQSVLDLLVLEARFRKVKIKTRETAVAVEKAENGYLVRTEGWQYPADSVIICCGSCASQIAGSDGDTLRFADQLQLASIPFSRPSARSAAKETSFPPGRVFGCARRLRFWLKIRRF